MAPTRARERAGATVPVVIAGLGVAPVLAANGGYYPTSWGWAAAAFAWGAVVVAAFRRHARPTGAEVTFIGGLAAFAVWMVVSMAWTSAPTGTPYEIERTLVYVAGALAVLAIVGPEQVRTFLGSICIGTGLICGYGLATRLIPDHFVTDTTFAGQRLSSPIGYWNGLGLVAAMSALLAVTFAARASSWPARAAAGGAIPILLSTLYYTFSRGSWGALVLGLLVLFLTDRRRLQLAFTVAPLALIGAFVVWESSRRSALTTTNATLALAAHQGHHLAALVFVAVLVSAGVAVAARAAEARWTIPVIVRRSAPWVTAAAVILLFAVVFAHYGSPSHIARRAYDSFVSPPKSSTSLNAHLFNFSNDGRVDAWRVGWHDFTAHPIGGSGGGSYQWFWNRNRPTNLTLTDAHSLYFETLAETGIVGFGILVAALLAPIVAFRRARREPLAAAALAAYVAYLAAAALEWDWELSGVTLVALFCGGAVLAAGRDSVAPAGRYRLLPLVLGSVVALAALYGLVGNLYLSSSGNASGNGDVARAAAKAQSASSWAPWSADPYQSLGEAQMSLGQIAKARASFLTAISKDPLDYDLWLDLGEASSGHAQSAAFAQAHRLNPRDDTASILSRQLRGKPAQ